MAYNKSLLGNKCTEAERAGIPVSVAAVDGHSVVTHVVTVGSGDDAITARFVAEQPVKFETGDWRYWQSGSKLGDKSSPLLSEVLNAIDAMIAAPKPKPEPKPRASRAPKPKPSK